MNILSEFLEWAGSVDGCRQDHNLISMKFSKIFPSSQDCIFSSIFWIELVTTYRTIRNICWLVLSEPNQEKTQKKILPSSQDSIFLLIFLVELAYEKSMLTLSIDYYYDYRKSWCVSCCLQEQTSFLINFKEIINFAKMTTPKQKSWHSRIAGHAH